MKRSRREFLRTGGGFGVGLFLVPKLPKNMQQQSSKVDSDLEIVASATSSHNDFDFHIGQWNIENKRLRTIFKNTDEWIGFPSTCESFKNLNGFGNINLYRFHKQGVSYEEGMVMRLFNPKTRLWTIYWAESNSVVLDVPVIGFFENKVGTFFAKDTFNGTPIIIRCIYDGRVPGVVIWKQAFSADKGETFETNWIMTGRKQG